MEDISIQEKYAPNSICFGCGPSNSKGLQIRSYVDGEELVAEWQPKSHHEAFPGMLNGGIIGALLDCHSNWTAAWHLMRAKRLKKPPCTVTANYAVKLFRPTPSTKKVKIKAKLVELKGEMAKVEAELISGKKVCATCRGSFIAVKPGHPAYYQWH
jgi:acyl-coenzyme A thioesterase PaaI-like protein